MASRTEDIDGQIEEHTFECDFAFNGGTGGESIMRLSPIVKNVQSIWISAYDIRGVPVFGGIPLQSRYYLAMTNVPSLTRVGIQDSPTGNAVPLYLNGAWTHYEFQQPVPAATPDGGVVNRIGFRLIDATGADAVFDSCTIYFTLVSSSQPTSLYKSIAHRPAINDTLNFSARPWIR